jgi:predicted transcriptional regulator
MNTNDRKFLFLDEIVLSEEADSDGAIPESLSDWGSGIPINLLLWSSNRGVSFGQKMLDKAVQFELIKINERDDGQSDQVILTEEGLTTWRKMRKARGLPSCEADYSQPAPNNPKPKKKDTPKVKKPEDMTGPELVAAYNELADKPVKKFADRETGVKRLTELLSKKIQSPKEDSKKESTGGNQKFAKKDGHTLHKLVEGNPRREGTQGHASWEALQNGMTYIEAIDAGARNRDLRWDILHGRIEIRDKNGNPVKVEPAKP